ncbi:MULTISPECIES: CobW-like GTP-binding protein [unclassified Pseudomonas]|uniref:CobW family GTP-binding protein n=1 Tax=unclassified Pseudomonas TaxID=196821 RepID=UPI002446F59F|nr:MULTISPECIES: CobW-like GTP-binding protein [unclassified Pseudomonas]MDH0896484.1 CobW-like GTP-binding protein [Pseudomonas sp. GD03875]MDH1065498.1 CobW-like GTP-binding protein [Pseudomonas sp. GD03985]
MLANIPTHLIAGPLGAGKTSLIRHLLAHKPAAERWAVLINEFGQIGLDQALLTGGQDGVAMAEIPGGCLCCVGGAPFQVGLARLLRQARPDRLLIEPSGLGHPAELLRQLGEAPWAGVLAVQPPVLVLDAAALAAGQALPDSQQTALPLAGLLLLNKAEGLDAAARARLQARLPDLPLRWTRGGALDFAELPGSAVRAGSAGEAPQLSEGGAPLAQVWRDPARPICQVQAQAEGWSIGWRFHPGQVFELGRVQAWLAGLPWRRAKLVLRGGDGWRSANALDGEALDWRISEWRKDSRLELIFVAPQAAEELTASLMACLRGSA